MRTTLLALIVGLSVIALMTGAVYFLALVITWLAGGQW